MAYQATRVGVIGLSATGTEVIRHLTLLDVGAIEVIDSEDVTLNDLGTNFFVRPEDIQPNQKRSVIIPRLECLHTLSDGTVDGNFKIKHASGPPDDEDWIKGLTSIFLCVCLPWDTITRIAEICHRCAVQFIIAVTFGPCCVLFEDFGDFVCESGDGFPTRQVQVATIRQKFMEPRHKKSLIRLEPGTRLVFQDMTIKRKIGESEETVERVDFLNGKTARVRAVNYRYNGKDVATYGIEFESDVPELQGPLTLESGVALEDKSIFVQHQALSDVSHDPIVQLFVAICKFLEKKGRMPTVPDFDEHGLDVFAWAKKIVHCCAVEYPPCTCLIGGAAIQEFTKYVTKQLKPLLGNQWFTIDESKIMKWTNTPRNYIGTRYEAIASIIGDEMVAEFQKSRAVIIGIGLIGSHYARLIPLFGFQKITISDGGKVNRQIPESWPPYLFLIPEGPDDQPKADLTERMIKLQNPDIEISLWKRLIEYTNVHELIGPDAGLVLLAVDFPVYRAIMADYCQRYRIPLVNTGHYRSQAGFEVIVPEVTGPVSHGVPGFNIVREKPRYPFEVPNSDTEIIQCMATKFAEEITWRADRARKLRALGKAATKARCHRAADAYWRERCHTTEQCLHWAFGQFEGANFGTDSALASLQGATHIKAHVDGVRCSDNDPILMRLKFLLEQRSVGVQSGKDGEEYIETPLESREELRNGRINIISFRKDNRWHRDFIYGLLCRDVESEIAARACSQVAGDPSGGQSPRAILTMAGGAGAAQLPLCFCRAVYGHLEGEEDNERPLPGVLSGKGLSYVRDKRYDEPGGWEVIEVRGSEVIGNACGRIEQETERRCVEWDFGAKKAVRMRGENAGLLVKDVVPRVVEWVEDRYLGRIVTDQFDEELPRILIRMDL
jgi:tRNA A37 threonylcarbamoyladenosine dehydratase